MLTTVYEKTGLTTMLKDYDPKGTFNADETALYYQCRFKKTLIYLLWTI